jgi:hypothetical protein
MPLAGLASVEVVEVALVVVMVENPESVMVLEVTVVTLEATVEVVVQDVGSVDVVRTVCVHPARNKIINIRNPSNPCRFIGPR